MEHQEFIRKEVHGAKPAGYRRTSYVKIKELFTRHADAQSGGRQHLS